MRASRSTERMNQAAGDRSRVGHRMVWFDFRELPEVMMRILMVDDHVMVLQGLKNLLSVMLAGLQIDTANDIANALKLAAETRYDLVLLDWHLEDCTGPEAIARLREVGCAARIVVLSGESSSAVVRSAVELGAAGFIPKRYSSEAMVSALDMVLQGGVFLPRETQSTGGCDAPGGVTPLIEAEQRMAGLTPRQVDVYRAAARGLPNKLIARELGIAESTVKTHLLAVYAALGVRNRTEAAYQASREGIRVG
jgi:DNA-binding NarL/FixJ family response regulator